MDTLQEKDQEKTIHDTDNAKYELRKLQNLKEFLFFLFFRKTMVNPENVYNLLPFKNPHYSKNSTNTIGTFYS